MLLNFLSFFKEKPVLDTPYRTLLIERRDNWQVRLSGGTEWGREHRQDLEVVPAKTYDEALDLFNRMHGDLLDEGWKSPGPGVQWD